MAGLTASAMTFERPRTWAHIIGWPMVSRLRAEQSADPWRASSRRRAKECSRVFEKAEFDRRPCRPCRPPPSNGDWAEPRRARPGHGSFLSTNSEIREGDNPDQLKPALAVCVDPRSQSRRPIRRCARVQRPNRCPTPTIGVRNPSCRVCGKRRRTDAQWRFHAHKGPRSSPGTYRPMPRGLEASAGHLVLALQNPIADAAKRAPRVSDPWGVALSCAVHRQNIDRLKAGREAA
ncbi:hypothetical protein A7A08_01691 [Methyloligella halotolerans]|uniref:Uncharacterized protein n=1 Tax=Methyloligella halotolerans TaxID=1177755 RepID=A0A1E2RZJ5_9HYPH|nr:hypothetical protein A7A08_01691 [Methyloligella halotolerans]